MREDVFSSEKVTARIKKRYDACGMTPHAIAELSDGELAESTIYRILNGTSRDPSFRSLVVMMRTMGGNVNELLEDEAPEEAVPPKVDETAERLIAIYERIISEQQSRIRRLTLGIIAVVAAVFIGWLIIDISHPEVGLFRY